MITFEEALNIIATQPVFGSIARIGFMESVGRVLAEPVVADVSMPPFNKAAMDGYACREADLPGPLRIIEEIPAGKQPERSVEPGTCSRIMTGAPLPEGADCVIMDEHTALNDKGEVMFTKASTKPNICYLGEDVREGDLLIAHGTLIRPEHIAIMASAGAMSVTVSKQPVIGVYSTGNELVEPTHKPTGSQIRNSNSFQIVAQLRQSGFAARYLGIIPDTAESTALAINEGFDHHDILVLTGGVSQGTYDFVPQVMADCGVEILFHHLAVQPGKPSLFGRRGDGKYVFGLPGNPVSSFIQTELLVKQLCYQIQGHHRSVPEIMLPLGVDYHRKRAARKSFVPVMINNSTVYPVEYHGSAHIQALNGTHGIITIEPGVEFIREGEPVHVRLF
jgi:molybdopterin molybdotransferase